MASRAKSAVCVIALWLSAASSSSAGAVIVVANRTPEEVRFSFAPAGGKPQSYAVATRDLTVIRVTGPAEISTGAGAERRRYVVLPNAAYYFSDARGSLFLNGIGFPPNQGSSRPPALGPKPAAGDAAATQPPARVITVKILVDQKEPGVRAVWEKRLRGRIDAASQVLDHICRTTLRVVAVDEWQSDGSHTDLTGLFHEFERRVDPRPAEVAVGFTSQPLPVGPETRVGVTGPALRRHVLLRENWAALESDRVDVLLHEFGHFFGAAHSPEPDSLMRPRLRDRPPNRAYLNRFDPVNTLIMNIVADEHFDRGVKRLIDLSPSDRDRLRDIYIELGRALPDDPTAGEYLRMLGGDQSRAGDPVGRITDPPPGTPPSPRRR